MKDRAIKPTSVRLERPLYEALNSLSHAASLPVGKLLRLAVIDYIGRLEIGRARLPQFGESSIAMDEVGKVIKKYREATKSRKPVENLEISDPLAERLAAIESRLARLEKQRRPDSGPDA